MNIKNPKIWWPIGHGGQPLYELLLTVPSSSNNYVDLNRHASIGIRNITHIHDPFYFIVNGYPIYMKGSSVVPMDYYPSRIYENQEIDWLIQSAIKSNLNTLRLWGGGNYMSDHFFDEADRLGLMIWHDMMFSCRYYPYYDQAYI